MEQLQNSNSRKNFLLWCSAIFSSLAVFKIISEKKRSKNKTVRMLGQDGKLVEVDITALAAGRKRISNKELQNWIKK
jgi:hypothetical protein